MNWQEALEEIQGVEFDVKLNVVSSEKAFFRAVEQEPAVQEAYRQMCGSVELRDDVLERLRHLAAQEIDPCYANPNDTSLAVLLWLICSGAPDYALAAADCVGQAPHCWYARKLARRILNSHASTAGSRTFPAWGGSEVSDGCSHAGEQKKERTMDVKEAARLAKEYVADLFAEEAITNLGLEEVEFDPAPGTWKITVGFSRPWEKTSGLSVALGAANTAQRSYKVVRIRDHNGHIESLRDRFLVDSRTS